MRILVTGATGRVGANLAKALLDMGHEVRAFVFRGDASRMDKLNDYDVEVIHGDLRDFDDVVGAVQGIEVIYHIGAAMRGPFDNSAYFDINAKGTFNVVEAARQYVPNLHRLVYASTDAIYPTFSDTEPGQVAREDMPVNPIGMYAFTKWVGERLVLAFHKQYGIPAVAFRFAWVIGAGEILDSDYASMYWLSKVLASYRARKGQTPEGAEALAVLEGLWSGEEKLLIFRSRVGMCQKQHFVDIRDLLQGLILGMDKEEAIGEVFTLPGPRMLPSDEVVSYLSDRLGIAYVEADLPINMRYRELSWEKANRLLGYTPSHDLASMVDLALAMRRGESTGLIPTGIPYGTS